MQNSALENIVFSAELSSSLDNAMLTKELRELEHLKQYTLDDLSRRNILTKELLEDEDVIGFPNPAGISYFGATIVHHFLKKKPELIKDDFANVVDHLLLYKYFQINGSHFPEKRISDIIEGLEASGEIELKNWELAIEDLPKVLRKIEGYIESRDILKLIPKAIDTRETKEDILTERLRVIRLKYFSHLNETITEIISTDIIAILKRVDRERNIRKKTTQYYQNQINNHRNYNRSNILKFERKEGRFYYQIDSVIAFIDNFLQKQILINSANLNLADLITSSSLNIISKLDGRYIDSSSAYNVAAFILMKNKKKMTAEEFTEEIIPQIKTQYYTKDGVMYYFRSDIITAAREFQKEKKIGNKIISDSITILKDGNKVENQDLDARIRAVDFIAVAAKAIDTVAIKEQNDAKIIVSQDPKIIDPLDKRYINSLDVYKFTHSLKYRLGFSLSRYKFREDIAPHLKTYIDKTGNNFYSRSDILSLVKKYAEKERHAEKISDKNSHDNNQSVNYLDDLENLDDIAVDNISAISHKFNHAAAKKLSAEKYQALLSHVAELVKDELSKKRNMSKRDYRESLFRKVLSTMLIDDGDDNQLREKEYFNLTDINNYVKSAWDESIFFFIEELTDMIINKMFPFREQDAIESAKLMYSHLNQSLIDKLGREAMKKSAFAYVNGKSYTRKQIFNEHIDGLVEEHFGIFGKLNEKESQLQIIEVKDGEETIEKKIVSRHDHDYIFPTQAFEFIDAISSRYVVQETAVLKVKSKPKKIIIPRIKKEENILQKLESFYTQMSSVENRKGGSVDKRIVKYHRMHVLAAAIGYLQQNYAVKIEDDILTAITEYKPKLLEKQTASDNDASASVNFNSAYFNSSNTDSSSIPIRTIPIRTELLRRVNSKPLRITPRMVQEKYPLKIDRDDVQIFLGEYLDAKNITSFVKQDEIIQKVLGQYQPNIMLFSTTHLVYRTLSVLK